MPAEEVNDGDEYPDGNNYDDDDDYYNDKSSGEEQSQEDNDTLGYAELTPDELKAAFRWESVRDLCFSNMVKILLLDKFCFEF